ncbi:hypothetical protein BGZ70_006531 [Mortierella alpina]|uniref:Protein-tyrosine-phosphatase n=1 Tax=Mortierella alpina TaxID=64518 RepID=A0A9P6JE73_MORAP|nr:hypothetical protein BGZ70_006531 [Mortierella alpina]
MSVSWLPSPLIPPFRFGTVEPEVYRGAYPKQRNLRYLKRLKLKTILSLIPDAPDEVFRQFCADQGIKSIHLPVDKVKDNVPLTYNRAVEAVQIIIDPDNLPIYVHCLDGASVTGLVVCCLRKLQTWNISSAMGEFLRYLRGGVISSEESVFVEKFASEIEISKPIPPWLWEGHVTFKKHPSLKLNFTIPPTAASASNATHLPAPSPTLSHQNSAAVFPSSQGDGFHNSINTGSISTTPGTTTSGASAAGMTSQSSAVSGAGATPGTGPLLPASSAGLINHASRSSAMATLRDRPSNSKSMIRTDPTTTGFGPRNASIATPATATLARNKRAMVGSQSGLAQQPSTLQPDQPVIETLGSPSGLGVRLNGHPSAQSDSRSAPGLSTDAAIKNTSSNLISQVNENGTGSGGGSGDSKDPLHSEVNLATRSDDPRSGETTNVAAATQQDRAPSQQHQSIAKTSPAQASATQPVAPQEPVEEYYEVSMTLKALALEGADF